VSSGRIGQRSFDIRIQSRRIADDRTMFYALYSWQVFVKTPRGDRRVTGPGLP